MERWVQVWQMTDVAKQPLDRRFPAQRVWDTIKAAAEAGEDLYNVDRDGAVTLMEPLAGHRPHLALHAIRRVNLPSEDAQGRIVDLSINPQHGLAEGTHFLFCPRNIVICLYNHNGPRIRRLGAWLQARMGLKVDFVPLYRTDTWAVIESMERLTKIEIVIPADQAASLGPPESTLDDDLLTVLQASGRATQGGLVHLVWTVGRGERAIRQSRMRQIAESLLSMDKRGFKGLKIYGRAEGVEQPIPVDLINDQLVTRRSVSPERERSRRLSTSSAYRAMDDTYEVFKGQIDTAIQPIPNQRLSVPSRLLPREADDEQHP